LKAVRDLSIAQATLRRRSHGAEGSAVRATSLAQRGVLGAAAKHMLHGDARPMIEDVGEAVVASLRADDDAAFARPLEQAVRPRIRDRRREISRRSRTLRQLGTQACSAKWDGTLIRVTIKRRPPHRSVVGSGADYGLAQMHPVH
jgi:hypothetical protein